MDFRSPAEADYPDVIAALVGWWGRIGGEQGAQLRTALLPRLWFQHFTDTGFVVRDDGLLVGFLVGFLSPARPGQAYVHFVGVHPDRRGAGLGRELYTRFFALAAGRGATEVHAITSVENTTSQDFHRSLGVSVSAPIPGYEGPYADRVTFRRMLG